MNMVIQTLIGAMLLLCGFYLWRILYGPTVFDRLVAMNGICTKSPLILVLIGLLYERLDMFADLAISLLMLNLFTTLLLGRYVRERMIKEE